MSDKPEDDKAWLYTIEFIPRFTYPKMPMFIAKFPPESLVIGVDLAEGEDFTVISIEEIDDGLEEI